MMNTRATETARPAEEIGGHHYLGIFLLSLATLLLELSLTRVLSVALWYHFGFLVISTALLGFGTSGVLYGYRNGRRADPRNGFWIQSSPGGRGCLLSDRASRRCHKANNFAPGRNASSLK
jgi:hypothetical protein